MCIRDRLLIYAPNFISVIVLCGMVLMFLSPIGPMNKILGISTNWMTMPAAFRTIYIASGIWPVSYTHLDVYKRQVQDNT